MTTTKLTNRDKAIIAKIEQESYFKKGLKLTYSYSAEQYLHDAKAYIKAISEGRMINSIGSVSNSGMSRTIKFLSCEKSNSPHTKQHWYRQYWCLFMCMGYSKSRSNEDYFSISGCGMDMIFHTNHSIIYHFKNIGLLNKKQCDKLCQMKPTTI